MVELGLAFFARVAEFPLAATDAIEFASTAVVEEFVAWRGAFAVDMGGEVVPINWAACL